MLSNNKFIHLLSTVLSHVCQDLISVEEKILGQMTRRTGRPRGGGGGGGGEITGREGQTLTLKCRSGQVSSN